jgi:XRE family transcriptional regulator, regulator of sulfur utilization
MTTRRILLIATVITTTIAAASFAQTSKPLMPSQVFPWNNLKVDTTKTGERRQVFDAPTLTLDRFESHITTLNPGEVPHAPHKHPEEELMIVKEGTLEVVQNNITNRVEAGGMIFCASNEMHGLKNVGTNRASYYVVKWFPHDLARVTDQSGVKK